jgi:hypothetical protein
MEKVVLGYVAVSKWQPPVSKSNLMVHDIHDIQIWLLVQ